MAKAEIDSLQRQKESLAKEVVALESRRDIGNRETGAAEAARGERLRLEQSVRDLARQRDALLAELQELEKRAAALRTPVSTPSR
jgi:hypothetical protein